MGPLCGGGTEGRLTPKHSEEVAAVPHTGQGPRDARADVLDVEAAQRLDRLLIRPGLCSEIARLTDRGYEVGFRPESERTDPAYATPGAIDAMYQRVESARVEYDRRERAAVPGHRRAVGDAAERLVSTPLRALVSPLRPVVAAVRSAREDLREDLLFSPDKMAWHRQAGKATALLTIAFAHELRSEVTGGRFLTMSGPLGEQVLDVVFDDRSSEVLRGHSISDAAVGARVRLQGRTLEDSRDAARRSLGHLRVFVGQPVSEDFKQIVQYCTDSLGIRTRKEKVREVLTSHVRTAREAGSGHDSLTLLSVGCGTAVPIFELASSLRAEGVAVHVILVDQDPVALAAAQCLADLPEFRLGDAIELHCRRLFSATGQALDLAPVIRGRRIDIVEDTGLREYLPPRVYRSLTRALWAALEPGGIMSTGNMITHRPQPEFLHGLMGWEPAVRMRTIAQGFALHESSGVPRGSTVAHVTADGVYAVYISTK